MLQGVLKADSSGWSARCISRGDLQATLLFQGFEMVGTRPACLLQCWPTSTSQDNSPPHYSHIRALDVQVRRLGLQRDTEAAIRAAVLPSTPGPPAPEAEFSYLL